MPERQSRGDHLASFRGVLARTRQYADISAHMDQAPLLRVIDAAWRSPGTLRERALMAIRLVWRRAHSQLVQCLDGFSLDAPSSPSASRREGDLHVGYYLWCYPLDSETFIRREIRAMREAGLKVTVLADVAGDTSGMDEVDSALTASTIYLARRSRLARLRWLLGVALPRPAAVVRTLLFLAATRYDGDKSVASDLATLGRTIDVAMTMQSERVNHLHAPWSNVNAFVLLLASRLLRLTCSMHARAHDLHRNDSAFALRAKFAGAHFVVTNTQYNLDGIRELLPPTRHDRVHLIRNGLDLAEYAPIVRGAREDVPARLLCVARLIEPKGLTTLLEACALLRDRRVRFVCDIVGGPEEPLYTGYYVHLRVMHRRLSLEDHVRFAGPQPQSAVRSAYQRADLFVLPCVVAANGSKDITPNALIEAMAMQLPVISTRITAIPEIVADGECGVLVPPGDAVALAEAIERCLQDASLRTRFGLNARRKVEETFDIRRNVSAYTQLFRAQC